MRKLTLLTCPVYGLLSYGLATVRLFYVVNSLLHIVQLCSAVNCIRQEAALEIDILFVILLLFISLIFV